METFNGVKNLKIDTKIRRFADSSLEYDHRCRIKKLVVQNLRVCVNTAEMKRKEPRFFITELVIMMG